MVAHPYSNSDSLILFYCQFQFINFMVCSAAWSELNILVFVVLIYLFYSNVGWCVEFYHPLFLCRKFNRNKHNLFSFCRYFTLKIFLKMFFNVDLFCLHLETFLFISSVSFYSITVII